MSEESFIVELNISGGETVIFKTHNQVFEWADTELKFWEEFAPDDDVEPFTAASTRVHWNAVFNEISTRQLKPFRDFLSEILIDHSKDGLKDSLSRLAAKGVLFSKTSKGQKLIDLKGSNPEAAWMLLSIWHPHIKADRNLVLNLPQLQNNDAFKIMHSALMDAYIERRLFENGFKGSARVEKKALITAKNDANQMLAEIAKQVDNQNLKLKSTDDFLKHISDKTDNFLKSKQVFSKQLLKKQINELKDLKRLYTEELALKIPVTYWKDKARDHRIAAYLWGVPFMASIASIIFFGSDIMHSIIEGLKIVDDKGNELFNFSGNQLSLFFALTFPAFLAVWVLRILSKNMLTNFNQMHDANNRVVMTQTFLALMSEGKADENDRILILNALFQPMSSSGDDGAPPHWFELMMERMKK